MKTNTNRTQKRILVIAGVALAAFMGSIPLQAQTRTWWRFEEGPNFAQVSHGGLPDGIFYPGTADSSGNGHHLSVWAENWAGYEYRTTQFGGQTMAGAMGYDNIFAVKNSGGYPAMFTESGTYLQSWQPTMWTVEATFKLENGGYKTIVGRDSQGSVTTGDLNLPAMSFQAVPGNGLAIKYCDVSGYWHEAVAPANSYVGFDWGYDPDGLLAPWYSMAAVSDGSTLFLYLRNVSGVTPWALIAQTDLTLSGSPDTTLTMGTGAGSDWDAGNFSVGRGLYAGGHGDRAYGYIDEVRLSDGALTTDDFLYVVVPEPSTLALAGLGILGMLMARHRS